MANDVDKDRLGATTTNETVVDLAAYRAAAAERKTSQAYAERFPVWMIVAGIAFIAFYLVRR